MQSKRRRFTLAEDIGEIMILWRNSKEISRYRDSRSGMEVTLLQLELHTKLNGAFNIRENLTRLISNNSIHFMLKHVIIHISIYCGGFIVLFDISYKFRARILI